MFGDIIAECRFLIEGRVSRKRKRRKELGERPEVSTGDGLSFPKRGLEKAKPYGDPGYRTTIGSGAGSHSQTTHT